MSSEPYSMKSFYNVTSMISNNQSRILSGLTVKTDDSFNTRHLSKISKLTNKKSTFEDDFRIEKDLGHGN